jgi:hypothetical protein
MGDPRFPARCWAVERTLAWLCTWCALLIRYAKHAANFRALLWFRHLHRLLLLKYLLCAAAQISRLSPI